MVDRYSNSRIIGTDATYVQTLYYTAWSTLRPFFAEDINVKEAATRTLQATALNWLLLTLFSKQNVCKRGQCHRYDPGRTFIYAPHEGKQNIGIEFNRLCSPTMPMIQLSTDVCLDKYFKRFLFIEQIITNILRA